MQTRPGHRSLRFLILLILVLPAVISLILPVSGDLESAVRGSSEAVERRDSYALNREDGYQRPKPDIGSSQMLRDAGMEDEVIAYWHFDEGCGDTAFDAVNGHDASLTNVTWDTEGYLGTCLAFDGEMSLVSVPHHAMFDSLDTLDLSFYLWLDSVETGEEDWIVVKGAYGADYLKVSFWNEDSQAKYLRRQVLFALKRGYTVASTHSQDELESETWHFIQVTYDGVTLKIFIDGTLSGEMVSLGRMPIRHSSPLIFGQGFSGKLDEVRLGRVPSSLIKLYLPAITRSH